jgi:hypothetical protein
MLILRFIGSNMKIKKEKEKEEENKRSLGPHRRSVDHMCYLVIEGAP